VLQATYWQRCGGTESAVSKNASDPGICCPVSSLCNYYSITFWQCQPEGWVAPQPANPEYNDKCTNNLRKVTTTLKQLGNEFCIKPINADIAFTVH
jgi:hypothetical protein